jgi:hypothetical protein
MLAPALTRNIRHKSSNMSSRWLVPLVLAALAGQPATASAAVPAQFIAKMYTEALGRVPDPAGWQSALQYFQTGGCNQKTLSTWGNALLASPEFNGLAYDDAATTLILYRAILNREPATTEYQQWYDALEEGQSLQAVATAFFDSAEFSSLVPEICSGNSYSFATQGTGLAIAIPMIHLGGYSNLSEAELQALLYSTAAGDTVFLQQESVVYLTQPLIIPAGVTLATQGLPDPHHHALMARLIRAAPFRAPMVQINLDANPDTSGSLRSLWIDGQRAAASGFVSSAIDVEIYGGNGASVESSFLTGSLGWSTLHSYGSLDGRPCAGNTISGNVVTAYASVHADSEWTDGLSIGCERSVVENNQIVDPTDVGIVVFTAYPAIQQSQVLDNTVESAGNSAFGALGFDPLQGRSAGAPDFTGAKISNNTLFSGPNTHFIIGLAVGSRPWYPQGSIGFGAQATDNTTAGIRTNFAAGIVVSGMQDATVQANDFLSTPIPSSWTHCPIGNVLASVSAGLASGSIQPYSDVEVNGCMSDYSDSGIVPPQTQPSVSAPRRFGHIPSGAWRYRGREELP